MMPTKGNGPTAGNSQPAKSHTKHAHILEATPAQVNIIDFTEERRAKDTVTLIAQFALAGHTVHRSDTGDFLVCRYGLSRWCKDFAELRAFAVRVGVRHE